MDLNTTLQLIKKALKTNEDITLESNMDNTPEWDSLGHLNILVMLNSSYEGRLSEIEELAEAGSVQKIISVLEKHGIN